MGGSIMAVISMEIIFLLHNNQNTIILSWNLTNINFQKKREVFIFNFVLFFFDRVVDNQVLIFEFESGPPQKAFKSTKNS